MVVGRRTGGVENLLGFDAGRVVLPAAVGVTFGLLPPPLPVAFGALFRGQGFVALETPFFVDAALEVAERAGGQAVAVQHVPGFFAPVAVDLDRAQRPVGDDFARVIQPGGGHGRTKGFDVIVHGRPPPKAFMKGAGGKLAALAWDRAAFVARAGVNGRQTAVIDSMRMKSGSTKWRVNPSSPRRNRAQLGRNSATIRDVVVRYVPD